MIVADAYINRKRVHRVYKGGELVWFAGDILPLSADLVYDSLADEELALTVAPLLLGNAATVLDHYFSGILWGTEVHLAQPGNGNVNTPQYCYVDNCLTLSTAVLGNGADIRFYVRATVENHGQVVWAVLGSAFKDHITTVAHQSSGLAADVVFGHLEILENLLFTHMSAIEMCEARLGLHFADHHVVATYRTTGIACDARLGWHFAEHHVLATYHSTGIPAPARMGVHFADHYVRATYHSTGIPAPARMGIHFADHFVRAVYHSTSIPAPARMGIHFADHVVRGTYHSTGIPAEARLGWHFADHLISATYHSTGIPAEARLGWQFADHIVRTTYFSTGIAAPARIGSYEADLDVIIGSAQTGLAALIVHGVQRVDVATSQSVDLNGTVAPARVLIADKTSNMNALADSKFHSLPAVFSTKNAINTMQAGMEGGLTGPIPAVLLVSKARTVNLPCVVEGGMTGPLYARMATGVSQISLPCAVDGGMTGPIDAVSMSDEASENYPCNVEGGMTDPIRIISLSSVTTVKATAWSKAHLGVWSENIQTGSDLYIRQIYEGFQTGNDLVLGERYDGEVTWLAPIQTDDTLYIRQVYTAMQEDEIVSLSTENWMAPIQTGTDLYIRQTYQADQKEPTLVLTDNYYGS